MVEETFPPLEEDEELTEEDIVEETVEDDSDDSLEVPNDPITDDEEE